MELLDFDSFSIINSDSVGIIAAGCLVFAFFAVVMVLWELIKAIFRRVTRHKDDKWQTVYLAVSEEGKVFSKLWRRQFIPRYNHLQLPEDDSYEDPIFEPKENFPTKDGLFLCVKAQVNCFRNVVELLLEPDEVPPFVCPGKISLDGHTYSVLLNVPPVKP